MKLSKNLKEILDQKKISLSQLSKKTGVPKTTLFSWLNEKKTNVSLSQLQTVARFLEVSVHQLAFGESDPYEQINKEILHELFNGDVRVKLYRIEKK